MGIVNRYNGTAWVPATVQERAAGVWTSATATVRSAGAWQAAPATWVDVDIGSPALAGSSSNAGGVYTINGAGSDIWGTVDQFHLMYQNLPGDGTVIARVASLTVTDAWARAGLMIKASATAMAPYVQVSTTGTQGYSMQYGFNTNIAGPAGNPPVWLKLNRTGSTVTVYISTDGAAWITVGSTTLAGSAVVGLFVGSHNNATLCTATFDNVSVITGAGVPASPTITSISPNPGPAGTVTLTGTNFISGATVSFGSTAATGVNVVGPNQITCTAPAHADGSVSVTVTTSAGSSGGFSFNYQTTAAGASPHLPFDLPNVSASPKKVLAHYFFMPISSLGNEPPAQDYYATAYIPPYGEGGGRSWCGGFFRNRPWPRAPLPGDFRLTDCDTDIRRARSVGIDGFFCNIMWTDVNDQMAVRAAYTQKLIPAAANYPGFLVAPMLDTYTFGAPDPNLGAQQLKLYYGKPSTWMDGGKMVVSNFAAEKNTPAWWDQLYTACNNLGFQIKYINVFLGGANQAANYAASGHQWGCGIWGPAQGANTIIGTSSPVPSTVRARTAGGGGGQERFLSPVWVQDIRPGEQYYHEALNTLGLTNYWQEVLNANADVVQLCTWSDYSEGSTFNATPSQGLVASDISAYYIARWKSGSFPPIVRDCLYVSYRNHVTGAPILGPQTGFMSQNVGGTPYRNSVEVLSFLTAPANVSVTVAGVTTTFTNVAAGVQRSLVPITAAGNVSATAVRSGSTVASVSPPMPIRSTMWSEDYSYFMSGSLRGTNAGAAMATDASKQFDPQMTSSGAIPPYPV